MMKELLLIISGCMKILFYSNHLLLILISLELINLALVSMSWQLNWLSALWILSMSVIHSVLGFLFLLLMIRYFGNDKSSNLL